MTSIDTPEGISSKDTAIQPSHMSKETQATAGNDRNRKFQNNE